jgi:hypothetical protein
MSMRWLRRTFVGMAILAPLLAAQRRNRAEEERRAAQEKRVEEGLGKELASALKKTGPDWVDRAVRELNTARDRPHTARGDALKAEIRHEVVEALLKPAYEQMESPQLSATRGLTGRALYTASVHLVAALEKARKEH